MASIRLHVQHLLEEDLPRVLAFLILSYLEEKEACIRTWGKQGKKPGEFVYPYGVTLIPGSSNEIAVADTCNHRIQVFTLQGEFLRMWESGAGDFNRPCGVTTSPEGEIVIADTYNNRIQVFTPEGKFLRAWGKRGKGPGNLDHPFGVSILPGASRSSYEVVIADTYNNRIQVFNPEGKFLRMWEEGEGEFNFPNNVMVIRSSSASYEVVVTESGNNRIQVFTPEGKFLRMWRTEQGWSGTEKRDVPLSFGKIIVADTFKNRIQVFSSEGKFLRMWGKRGEKEGEFYCPRGVAALSPNEIVVADTSNNRIQVFITVLD